MTRRHLERVKKRDGRVVDYDEAKLAEAIYRAARSVGQDNRYLARDLAGVVTTYLERYHDREIPTSEEIQRMVEKILFETGHAEVARAYLIYREHQGTRSATPPEALSGELFPTEPVFVEASTRDEVSTWGRDRISAALVKEAGLDPASAGEIASAVEQKIFREGHRRVSSTLIRELVNQELLARGYVSKMRKQLVVGLPKYDLDRLLRPGTDGERAIDPDRMCRMIGETTLKQYALQELHPREVADAHIEGRLHIHDLEYPLKLHWVALHVPEMVKTHDEDPALSSVRPGPRALGTRLDARIAAMARVVAGGVELSHVNAAYAPMLLGSGDDELSDEAAFVAAQLARVERPRLHVGVDLGIPSYLRSSLGAARGPAIRFARELLRVGRDMPCEIIFHVPPDGFDDPDGASLLREACRFSLERGRSLFCFERPGSTVRRISRFGGRGASDPEDGPFVLAQAVTINLPQAYYRSEGSSDFYAELEVALDALVRAHLVKRALLRRPRGDSAEFAVAVAGLNEAVRLLCGAEMADDENALRLGIRILSFLYFRVREESEKHGIRLAMHDLGGTEAAERFLRIDRQMFARARGLEAQLGPMSGYTAGVHLRSFPDVEAGLASEARFHTLLTQGAALLPASARASLTPARLLDHLRTVYVGTSCAQVSIP
ncbi:MAG: hypothetical protein HY716_04935 [Planctomycetes bacterium]|nr:hypothetical protein [Planctomycetota bacterium]